MNGTAGSTHCRSVVYRILAQYLSTRRGVIWTVILNSKMPVFIQSDAQWLFLHHTGWHVCQRWKMYHACTGPTQSLCNLHLLVLPLNSLQGHTELAANEGLTTPHSRRDLLVRCFIIHRRDVGRRQKLVKCYRSSIVCVNPLMPPVDIWVQYGYS